MEYTIITGASGGIDEALAHQLAQRKHKLILVAWNENKLSTLCKALTVDHQISVIFIVAYLSEPEAVQGLCNEIHLKGLTISMLVNNAGMVALPV